MVLIILILSMSIRSRKREIGILLAVGIEKYAVLLQQMLEICLVAIVAFPLAYLASREMAGTLGTLFGKDVYKRQATERDRGQLYSGAQFIYGWLGQW